MPSDDDAQRGDDRSDAALSRQVQRPKGARSIVGLCRVFIPLSIVGDFPPLDFYVRGSVLPQERRPHFNPVAVTIVHIRVGDVSIGLGTRQIQSSMSSSPSPAVICDFVDETLGGHARRGQTY